MTCERKTAQLEQVRALLREHHVQWTEPTPWHFKIQDINYYPSTCRIHVDGEKESRPCTPEALVNLIGERSSPWESDIFTGFDEKMQLKYN